MTWQPWAAGGDRAEPLDPVDPVDPLKVLLGPVLVGLLTGFAALVVGFVLIVPVALAVSDRTADDGWLTPVAAAVGSVLFAGAAALATSLTGQRLRAFRLRAAVGRRTRLGTGLAVGALGLLLGLAPGMRAVNLPVYLVAITLGCLLAERRMTTAG